jgi:polyhydroxyalkanoate synthesis regulator phasin
MFDTFKKGLMTGLGVGLMTKSKIEEYARKVAMEAKLSELEGRKFVDDMVAESKKTQEQLEERIQNAVSGAVAKANIATKEDIAALEARISKLEDRDA